MWQTTFRRAAVALAPPVVILIAPLLGVLVLRAPLFNNLPYRDPWFYSGYAWSLAHHVEIFGWFYYAVRFPVILPIQWTTEIFGPVTGYVVLRYLLLVAAGGLLYGCVRRFSSVAVGCASVIMLAASPFYVRMVLWDYGFVVLPCSIAGVALWFVAAARGRGLWRFIGAGALLSAAVFASALAATVVIALLAVEGIGAARGGLSDFGRFTARCVAAAAGGLLVFIAGYLGYRVYLGPFPIRDLVQPILEFMRQNNQLSAPFQRPVSDFLHTEPRIYAPVLLSLAVVVVLGRSLLDNSLRARVAQFAVGYVTLLWLYRFAITSSVLETWWAYSMAAVSMCFAVPVILDGLRSPQARQGSRGILAAAVLGMAVTSVVVRSNNSAAVDAYDSVKQHVPLLLAVLGAGVATAVAMTVVRIGVVRIAATAVFFALVAAVGLTPATYIGIARTGEFVPDGHTQVLAYRAAYDMTKLLERRDQPDGRILIWTTQAGLPLIAWTDLPHQGGAIGNAETPDPVLNKLTPEESDLVRYPTTRGLLVLSEDPADMTRALTALRREHIPSTVRRRGTWADGYLHYELLYLRRHAG